jgi:hypothetical protein
MTLWAFINHHSSFSDHLKIYKEIVNQGEDLKSFIDISRDTLRGIGNIDELRRALYITKPNYWATRKGWEAEKRVEHLLYSDRWPARFKENKIIPLQEAILFERDFLSSVHEWFAYMTSKELMLQYLPIHELTMTKLRDQVDELKKAHEMKPIEEKEDVILDKQKQIAETLWTIAEKMPV